MIRGDKRPLRDAQAWQHGWKHEDCRPSGQKADAQDHLNEPSREEVEMFGELLFMISAVHGMKTSETSICFMRGIGHTHCAPPAILRFSWNGRLGFGRSIEILEFLEFLALHFRFV